METPDRDSSEKNERAQHRFRVPPPPPGGVCVGCGSAEIASLPTHSVGAGLSLHPMADDVLCLRCGKIAPVHFLEK